MIPKPVILRTGEILEPVKVSVTLSAADLPKAVLTLAEEPGAQVHELIECFTAQGSAGIFRVTDRAKTWGGEVTVNLAGAVDTLSDDVFPGTAKITGTPAQALAAILAKQTTARWQLGRCAMTGSVKIENSYKDLYELAESVRKSKIGYFWTYDFTTTPWTLNLDALPDTVAAEFRLGRNVESAKIDLSDADMCTKLYMTVTSGKTSTLHTFTNTEAAAQWGVITKTIDVNAEDMTGTAQDYADAIFAERAQPVAYITLEGYDLKRLTGDDFDRIRLGSNCRVTLPDFGGTFTERVTKIEWPDALGEPDRIKVSLANNLTPFREQLNLMKKTGSGAAKTAAKTEHEMVVYKSDIENANGKLSLWASAEEWDEIAQTYQDMGRSQFDLTWNQIQSTVQQTGAFPGTATFSPTATYEIGNRCIWNGVVYQFTAKHEPGPWTGTDAQVVPTSQSKVTQTAAGLESEVTRATGAEGQLSSRISQTESDINLVVENTAGGGRQVSKAALLLAINGSGGSTAYLEAGQVKLSASGGSTVTLDDKIAVLESQSFTNTNLYVAGDIYAMTPGGSYHAIAGAVVIPEGKLLTFNQTGNNVNVYAADMAAMKTGFTSVTGSESGGQVTLTFGRADGSTAGTVTFNRATASKVSGGWSSGNYVVSADPNGSDLPLTLAVTNTLGGVSNTTYVQASDQWLGDVTATPAVGGASGTGATYQIDVRDAVLKGREIGWADAAGAIVWPGTGTGQSFSVTAPSGTPDTTFPRSFTLSESGGYIYCSSDGKNVARYQYPARSYAVSETPTRSGKLAPSGYSQLGSTITGYNTGHTYIQFTITANGTAHKYYIDVNVP